MKKAPGQYRLSDSPKDVDFYSIYVKSPAESIDMLVDQLHDAVLEGMQWSVDQYRDRISYRLEDLSSDLIEITHHYGPVTSTYRGWKSFRVGDLLGYPKWAYRKHRLQVLFGSRFIKFANDRFKLLEKIVELHVFDQGNDRSLMDRNGTHSLTLYYRLYGRYVSYRPDHYAQFARYELYINSLVAEEALSKDSDHLVKVGPKAMTILSDYAIAQRRHRDAIWQNAILIFLTFVLIIATALGPWISSLLQ
jgi:hypothetical protein